MKLDLNKILEYFNNSSDQVRYAILGGLVFVVILLDVFFLVLPQMGSISDLNDQIKKLSDDTQQVLTDRERTNLLKKNLQTVRDQFQSLNMKLRTVQEVPVILSDISSIANQYGVKIDQLVPEKEQQEDLKVSGANGKYYALPVEIKAHCGYHMFGRFLNKLENQKLYFIVKDFIIQNDDKDPNSRLFSLTIKIILSDQSQPSKNL